MTIERKFITVQFDPAGARASMDLWRDATDMKIPVADEFKIHFMQNRRPLLTGFERTGKAWRMILADMSAGGADGEELAQLRFDVDRFIAWAQDGLREIARFSDDPPAR